MTKVLNMSGPALKHFPLELETGTIAARLKAFASGGKNINTVSIGELLRNLSAQAPGMDISFLVFAAQIRSLDQQATSMLKSMDQLSKLQQSISDEMEKVQNLKTLLKTNSDWCNKEADLFELFKDKFGDTEVNKTFASWLADPKKLAELKKKFGTPNLDSSQLSYVIAREPKLLARLEKEFPLRKLGFELDTATGKVITKDLGGLDGNAFDGCLKIKVDHLESYETTLKGMKEKLTSGRQIEMIKLNSLIAKKGQATTLLSNLQKSQDTTKNNVIRNFA